MYKVGNTEYKKDSAINQAIIKAFISREVRCEMTEFVDYVFDTAKPENAPPMTMEDIQYGETVAYCPSCGEPMSSEPLFASELHLNAELNPDTECDPEERYLCPICGAGYASFMAATFCCESLEVYQCHSCQHVIPAEEYEDALASGEMPNEWWAVTPWLLDKLQAKGATILEKHNLWGRVEISSAIPLHEDPMLVEICYDLGILEGQEQSWSKHVKIA